MGVLIPRQGFLSGLSSLCRRYGALLIADEVMTGFRLARGGAQERFSFSADLTTLGKVIGGGLPVGAYGGRKDLMAQIAPEGPIYQAGTLSGNPLAVAAGIACLEEIDKPGAFDKLEAFTQRLVDGLARLARRAGVPLTINRVGSMWTAFFSADAVFDYPSAKKSDVARFGRFFHAMLEQGVYLPPSQFEAAFCSLAHTDADLERTLAAAESALGAGN
jgi:glutamate-1-semialdehyde 2,1-aminomutase